MTVDEAIESLRQPDVAECHCDLCEPGHVLADEVERLRASENRLTLLLGDALAHTPETYRTPILERLKVITVAGR